MPSGYSEAITARAKREPCDFCDGTLSPRRVIVDGRLIDQAMMRAAWEALRVHREAGQPLAIWRDGRVAWVSPDEFERGLLAAARG